MRATKLALGLAGLLAAGLAAPAMAATTIWNFQTSNCTTNGSSDGNNHSCTPAGAPSVTAYAFANTVGAANTQLEQGIIQLFSGNGLGVKNKDRPGGPGDGNDDTENSSSQGEHAIDNEDRFDIVLLAFSEPVKLTHLEIGWKSNDSDMTVLAFTGGDGSSCSGLGIAGQTYSALTGCGWNFVHNLSNVPEDSLTSIGNAATFSQYWLIGTYLGISCSGATDCVTISADTKIDHVKLIAVKGDTGDKQVPEPGTLLLLAAGALGLWWRRRVR